MKKLLWLDDLRDPSTNTWLKDFSCLGEDCKVFWVKSYYEFIGWITVHGLPDGINFDHDLEYSHYTPEEYWNDYEKSKEYQEAQGHERTGFHCAKWLVSYCLENDLELPTWSSHSANPVGRDNINNYLFNEKYKNKPLFDRK